MFSASQCLLTAVSCLCLLPILHATVFRLDELISLCTLIYTPIAGIVAAVTFATAIMYTLLAPCCWTWKRSTVLLPLILSLLYLLKRDLDHNLLPEFSQQQLQLQLLQVPEGSQHSNSFVNKVVLVTGANSGVGLSVAQAMGALGATVVMGCRSQERCNTAAKNIPGAIPLTLDLASFASIHNFADTFLQNHDRLDILFCNARFAVPPSNGATTTVEGFELGLGTMHFGHFLLFARLRETIANTAAAAVDTDVRVVMTSSAASQVGFMGASFHDSIFDASPGDLRGEITTVAQQYGRSKLANVLFARRLQQIMPEITTCSCHVGAVATSIWKVGPPSSTMQRMVDGYTSFVMRNLEEGGRTILKCALSQDDDVVHRGAYLDGMGLVTKEDRLHPPSKNDSLAKRLWEVSAMVTRREKVVE